jgi:hypothetical protein
MSHVSLSFMYCLLCDAVGVSDDAASNGSIIRENELERILKEAVVTLFGCGLSICVNGREEV